MIAVGPNIQACRLDSIFGAQHCNQAYGMKARSRALLYDDAEVVRC